MSSLLFTPDCSGIETYSDEYPVLDPETGELVLDPETGEPLVTTDAWAECIQNDQIASRFLSSIEFSAELQLAASNPGDTLYGEVPWELFVYDSFTRTFPAHVGTADEFNALPPDTKFFHFGCQGCCIPCPNLGLSGGVAPEVWDANKVIGTISLDGTEIPNGVKGGLYIVSASFSQANSRIEFDDLAGACDPDILVTLYFQAQDGSGVYPWGANWPNPLDSANYPFFGKTITFTVKLSELKGTTLTLDGASTFSDDGYSSSGWWSLTVSFS